MIIKEGKCLSLFDKRKTLPNSYFRLALVVKLAIIMGITWTREVIGAFFDGKKVDKIYHIFELFMDFIICLQGESTPIKTPSKYYEYFL